MNMKPTSHTKTLLITFIAMAAALVFSAPSHGQEAKGKQIPGWLQKDMEKVTKVVTDLNEEQKTKLADAMTTRTEALAKVNKQSGASEEETKAKSKEAWSAYTHQVKTFLTDAQFEKFKELNKTKTPGSGK